MKRRDSFFAGGGNLNDAAAQLEELNKDCRITADVPKYSTMLYSRSFSDYSRHQESKKLRARLKEQARKHDAWKTPTEDKRRKTALRNAGRSLVGTSSNSSTDHELSDQSLADFTAARKKKNAEAIRPSFMGSTRCARINREFTLQLSDHNWRDLPRNSKNFPIAAGYRPLDLYQPMIKTASGTTQQLRTGNAQIDRHFAATNVYNSMTHSCCPALQDSDFATTAHIETVAVDTPLRN
jgi:hypothetical protein